MYKKITLVVVFAVTGLIIMAMPLLAQEVYLVGADQEGNSNYILCNLDGTFSNQQYMGQIPQPYYTYGNGIGDFDNDADFDYIIGTGYSSSGQEIYLYEKLGDGNTFAAPVSVDTWTEGSYPMDMAVADYNNDGNMDFVLTHYGSSNCELYLGNGNLTFTRSILYSTAPYDNIGADAGDFNNDGNADFVASDYSGSDIYINLGNGDGTFTTTSFTGSSSSWGVTAGDFDNDGNDDIIHDSGYDFYFYKGNGDGTFQAGIVISGVEGYGASPVDNFDFNSDGNMDLVIGYGYSVRYYSGNGDGTFTYVTEITDGGGYERYSLSAPPAVMILLGSPVADAEPDTQIVSVGGTANFDGSNSYDTDGGTIVSYEWNFGDGNTGTGVTASHTYTTEKTYRVRLTVTDNDGKKGRDYVTVIVQGSPPIADANGPYNGGQFVPLTFNGSGSTDDFGIVRYEWDFGDGSTGIGKKPTHTYTSLGTFTVTLTVYDVVGQSDISITTANIIALPPRVNVMPGNLPGKPYPYTWPGRLLTIWGNVHHGAPPYTFIWEFGDGSAPVSGAVTDPKYISVTHTYATMGPKRAVLTVTDANSLSDQDTVEIEVAPSAFDVRVSAAIEDGLRYLYLHQLSDGRWSDYGCDATTTALAVLAFENQGHLPINDYNEDIYAEYVKAGLDYLTSILATQTMTVQDYGNPEEMVPGNTDSNGIGVYPESCYPPYEIGMVMMAMVGSGPYGSGAPDLEAPNGPVGVVGRTYRELVVDMVDYCAWAQNEASGSSYRGGWRYGPNYSSSDNSVSQWPPIGMEAAETNWEISAPGFVKDELELWINASQINGGAYDGGFYYDLSWYSSIAPTGAGLCEMAYCDIPQSDPRFQRAVSHLEYVWNSVSNKGFYYGMYAVAKGCRIAVDDFGELSEVNYLGSLEWYPDYAEYLMAHQNTDGLFYETWFGTYMDQAWALLVLEKTVVGLPPVAVIVAPASVPPNSPFNMDGSHSYHKDPNKMIVQWLWDFDKSDGVDWNNPDAVGTNVVNPGYSLPVGVLADSFVVTLRVADNSDSVLTDIAEHTVIVNFENHCPIADAGGPYAAKIGEIITFDGTGSYDLDSGDYITSYSWDINGDGIFGDCTDSVCYYSWNYIYSGRVGLLVTDAYGCISDTAQGYVTVWTSEVDVGISSSDIFFSTPSPNPGDTIIIYAVVHCDTASDPVSSVKVRFWDGDPDIAGTQINGDQMIYNMVAGDVETVQVTWCVPDTLPRQIYVRVDPDGELEEYNENNNEAIKVIEELVAGCKLFVTPEVVTVDPGDTAHFMVGVWNMSGEIDDYLLRLSGLPPDFIYSLPETLWGVGANDTMDAPLEITLPHDLAIWSDTPYPFTVACTSITYPNASNDTAEAVVIAQANSKSRVRFTDVLLDSLIAQVEAADIQAGVKNSLLSNLYNAEKKKEQGLERLEAGDTTVAMNMFNAAANIMGAFINEVQTQRGKKIAVGDADSFIAQAEDIIWRLQTGIWEGVSPPPPKIVDEETQSPQRFELSQNYPNPFNPITQIRYAIPTACQVRLEIYNLLGQKVTVLVDEYQPPGQKTVNWEAKDLSSGIYFYKLSAGDFTATRKMVLTK